MFSGWKDAGNVDFAECLAEVLVDGGGAATPVGCLGLAAGELLVEGEIGVTPGVAEGGGGVEQQMGVQVGLPGFEIFGGEHGVEGGEEGGGGHLVQGGGGRAECLEVGGEVEVRHKGLELGEGVAVVGSVGIAAGDVVHLRAGHGGFEAEDGGGRGGGASGGHAALGEQGG